MSEKSKIEWTDSTFNPWEGCQKTGPGCDNCYAERRNARFAGGAPVNFGVGAPRRRTSKSNWNNPGRWNKAHDAFFAEHGRRQRVFCASLADWLDNAVDTEWLVDLLDLVRLTPNLDWLLLSKRIGNWRGRLVAAVAWIEEHRRTSDGLALAAWINDWLKGRSPKHVWLGSTVVNQPEANREIPKLLGIPAAVRFLSIEPMLGPINLASIPISGSGHHEFDPIVSANALKRAETYPPLPQIDWVICGGESGPDARPMHPDWARSLRDQCEDAGVAFLFKQWGEWLPINQQTESFNRGLYRSNVRAKLGEDQGALDESYGRTCTVAQTVIHMDGSTHGALEPMAFLQGTEAMLTFNVGTPAAGRLLDGVEHNGYPALQP